MIKEKASKVELSLWFWALPLYTYNVLWYDEGVEVQSDVSGKGLAAGTTGRKKPFVVWLETLTLDILILNNVILIFIS